MDPNDETAILQIRQRLENIKAAPQFFNRISREEAGAKATEFYMADVEALIGIAEHAHEQAIAKMAGQYGALKAALDNCVKALLERGMDAHAPEIVVAKQLL